MKKMNLFIFVVIAGIFTSCAATVPKELTSARNAYQRISNGITAQVAPAELHVAKTALTKAEQSFINKDEAYLTRDLSYIAEKKCEIAETTASILMEQKKQSQAKADYLNIQTIVVARTKKDLDTTRTALVASEFNSEIKQNNLDQSNSALAVSQVNSEITKANLTQAQIALAESERTEEIASKQLVTETEARLAAEKKAAEAQTALAKLAAVKNEPRGMVITLSGSVLFASNKSVLLPEAQKRLDQVLDVLFTTKERHLTVEGYTDSQGSDSDNIELSQRRADAVRSYLVKKGYEGDLIKANGLGETLPVADNSSPEGRANNRRVEIIIERDLQTSK
ncbi:MAG TPA: OmpA family protein [bacterium]|nr:OmpA family protein [bacterium]